MIKPRFGFYITEKFPKAFKTLPDGTWEIRLPDGAVVFYDVDAFLNTPDEELLKYCEELVEHFGLTFEAKHLLNIVSFSKVMELLPKDRELLKKVIEQTPGLEIVEDTEEKREDA